MTDRDLRSGILRVLDADGRTAGSGFLLTADGLIATCAHVIGDPGIGRVRVRFLLADALAWAAVVPEYWRDADAEDVAILCLEEPPPPDVEPLRLRTAAGSAGNRFMTYGFPEVLMHGGLWGYGRLGHLVDHEGVSLLQLSAATETSRGFSGGPVIDQASRRVVGMISTITPPDEYGRLAATGFATPAETLLEICPLLHVADVCPYRSLDYFTEEHAAFFFGRATITERLVRSLRTQPRCLAVLGPSGSGKTSLIRAGLVPRIRAGVLPESRTWEIAVTRPATVLTDPPRDAQVVIVDQFEEVFRLGAPAVARVREWLTRLLESPAPTTVVIVMRDDFYSRLADDMPDLMDRWVVPNLVNVPATLSLDEIASIVREPAAAVGLELEDGLVDDIVAEVVAASGLPGRDRMRSTLLPLLEFSLTEVWRAQDDGRLRRLAFRELGGVAGGLLRWADGAYYGLSEDERLMARQILTALVQLGDEETGTPDTRRQVVMSELAGDRDVAQVLGHLATARLVVTQRDDDTGRVAVELIHDSLLREWRLLRRWLDEDRRFLAWRQFLGHRLRDWYDDPTADPDGADWLRGRELDQAVEWWSGRASELAPRQRAFIEGSIAARRRAEERDRALRERAEREEREARRQRELAETRALVARLRAEAEEAVALLTVDPARGLASAIATVRTNLTRLGGEPLGFVQASLFRAVRSARERRVFAGHGYMVTGVAFAPGGEWLVSGSEDRTVRLWPLVPGDRERLLARHDRAVTCVAVSPDGALVAFGGADGAVRLVRTRSAGESGGVTLDPPFGDAALAVSFRPDGRVVAASGADGLVRCWSVLEGRMVEEHAEDAYIVALAYAGSGERLYGACGDGVVCYQENGTVRRAAPPGSFATALAVAPSGEPVAVAAWKANETMLYAVETADGDTAGGGMDARVIGNVPDLVASLVFSPDGSVLVSADQEGVIRLMEPPGAPIDPLLRCPGPVRSVAVSPDSRFIAAGAGSNVHLWDWVPRGLHPDGVPVRSPAGRRRWDRRGDQAEPAWFGHDHEVYDVAFTHDGGVVAGGGRALRIWDSIGTERVSVPEAHDGAITCVACSPRGFPVMATGGRDNTIRLWDATGAPLGRPFIGHKADVMALAFAPNGELIASSGRDRDVRLWRVDGTAVGAPFDGHTHSVVAVAFHPGGDLLASAGGDGTVRLWRLDGTLVGDPLVGHDGYVQSVAFSPDGQVIASCSDDRTIRLWDLDGRPIGRPLRGHTMPVRAVGFHPSGDLVVSAGLDGTLRTWDRDGGPVTWPFEGHNGAVYGLAVDAAGELVATGGADGTVRLWRLGTWRDWLGEGCERLSAHPLLIEDPAVAEAVTGALELLRPIPDSLAGPRPDEAR